MVVLDVNTVSMLTAGILIEAGDVSVPGLCIWTYAQRAKCTMALGRSFRWVDHVVFEA